MANNIANKLVINATTEEEIEKFLSAIIGVEKDEFLHIDFERILPTPECLLKCESIDWYDWRINNWGTTWNAYDTDIDCCDGSVVLSFYTANHGVIPVIKKLIEMFPNLEFIYKFADEVIACNCGEGYGADGSASFKSAEDESDEAMALYIECWQEEWDNFKKTKDGWIYN